MVGVRTGDKGVDTTGQMKPNYEPGLDLKAKVTVFGDGSRGNLTKTLLHPLGLDEGRNGQGYEVGIEEV